MRRLQRAHWRRLVAPPLCLCAAVLLSVLSPAAGRSVTHAQPLHAAPLAPVAAPTGHVTVIVLDMSGSMAQNDPAGLRCSAANAYIDLSGPGDFVGVIGLDNAAGARGGPHTFQQTVDWGLAPREMSTVNARTALRDAIAQKSNNCKPDASTPTYDALFRAQAMLAGATNGGAVSGSVILLTDGQPDPDTAAQQSAIQSDLLPQFKQHGWPIDVIALGSDTSFHGFLSSVASATSGAFYDDGHGAVPAISPLNITPFFLDIFRLRNGRSPGPDVAPTQLGGGVTARNFTVGQYVSHLDIVVVKDTPATSVSLLAPNGQRFPPAAAGTFISTDPHYAIFAIDTPQQGPWEVDVSGGGMFLMDSLKVSSLSLGITAPAAGGVLAIGEQFTVSASVWEGAHGTPISGGRFSLTGTLVYSGGVASPYAQDLVLADSGGSGVYSAAVTVPASAPTGSYTLTVRAHAASEDVLTAQTVVRLDLFPSALLISPATNAPTTQAIGASVVGWDPVLRAIYRLPVIGGLGGLALENHPADPAAVVRGQVLLNGRPYSDATVGGTATRAGGTASVPVTVLNDGNGAFRLVFPSDAAGTYRVGLTTSGAYAISHGDLTHVTRSVLVSIAPATAGQELRAWLVTLIYLLLLALILLVIRYAFAQKPFGMLVNNDGSGGSEFARAQRGAMALLAPSRVTSRQMGMDPGVEFGFHRGGRITIRGATSRANYRLGGDPVPTTPVSATEGELSLAHSPESYTVVARRALDAYDEDEERPSQRAELLDRIRGRRRDPDADDDRFDDDDDRPRRGFALFAPRRRYDDEDGDDEYDDAPRSSRRARSQRQRDDRYDEDDSDSDDAYAGRRPGRSRRRYDDD